ncbi:hypothetical protein MHYP_G00093550 [Metynnis hypsauchen]
MQNVENAVKIKGEEGVYSTVEQIIRLILGHIYFKTDPHRTTTEQDPLFMLEELATLTTPALPAEKRLGCVGSRWQQRPRQERSSSVKNHIEGGIKRLCAAASCRRR